MNLHTQGKDDEMTIIPEGIPGVWMPEANYRMMESRIRELEKENELLKSKALGYDVDYIIPPINSNTVVVLGEEAVQELKAEIERLRNKIAKLISNGAPEI